MRPNDIFFCFKDLLNWIQLEICAVAFTVLLMFYGTGLIEMSFIKVTTLLQDNNSSALPVMPMKQLSYIHTPLMLDLF